MATSIECQTQHDEYCKMRTLASTIPIEVGLCTQCIHCGRLHGSGLDDIAS